MTIKSIIKRIIAQFRKKEILPIKVPVVNGELLRGKTALVTGGCGGIGFAIAESLIKNGAKVIITGTSESKLRSTCEKLGGIHGILLNLSDPKSIEPSIDKAYSLFGEINILVNTAGTNSRKSFFDTTPEEFDKIINVNVRGTYFVCQAVAKRMKESGTHGHILNLSSSSALRPAWSPYRISKWAIDGLTRGLADILLPYGIIVNAIAPGPTATPMMGLKDGDSIENDDNPSGRYATPEEIAHLATFMVSSFADMVVGDTFYITGGSGTISLHH